MIETYLLEYFLSFLKEGTLSKASEKLHVSQPALTKAMKKLEGQLGVSLFERSRNRLVINENGKNLSPYMQDVLVLEERLLEKAREIKEEENRLVVEMTAPGPTFRFPEFFFFRKSRWQPEVHIKTEAECLHDVETGYCDIAFINTPMELKGFIATKVFEERLFVSLPKEHFLAKKKEGIAFSDIDGQSFLVSRSLGIWEDVLQRKLTHSRLFHQDADNLQEIVNNSSLPSFITNITRRFRDNTNRVFLPIQDKEATIPWFALFRIEKKHFLEEMEKVG